jgi:phage-related minor tail protein
MLKRLQAVWTAVKGWKTVVVSAVLAIVGVLQTADWATIVRPQLVGPTILGVAALVAVLRTLTDTPIGRRTGTPTSGGDAG